MVGPWQQRQSASVNPRSEAQACAERPETRNRRTIGKPGRRLTPVPIGSPFHGLVRRQETGLLQFHQCVENFYMIERRISSASRRNERAFRPSTRDWLGRAGRDSVHHGNEPKACSKQAGAPFHRRSKRASQQAFVGIQRAGSAPSLQRLARIRSLSKTNSRNAEATRARSRIESTAINIRPPQMGWDERRGRGVEATQRQELEAQSSFGKLRVVECSGDGCRPPAVV